jgi:hypothetical protein
MKFWRIFIITFLSTLYFVLCPGFVHAQSEFSVDSVVTYNFQDSGKTLVTHNTTLENNFSTLYATTYGLSLENIDAENIQASDDKGNALKVDIQKDSGLTKINITFPDAVVGKGAQRHFSITYESSGFAVKTGEVWEVSVPRLGENSSFRNYTVNLVVPPSFGAEAYVSPKPKSVTLIGSSKNYTFTKESLLQTGVTAGFGQFQVFTFTLSYHLENPLSAISQTQIALPPDTAYQKIYFSNVDPRPDNMQVDQDGNWLATYKLEPRQRIDVTASGSVQIFSSFRQFPKPTDEVLSQNLKESQYWQVNDPNIKALALSLKTPKAIYDYVVKTLKYDFSRVQPNVQRMGAKLALQNPDQAICMEFTDTFIAIARAAGIPAREINGYAYADNPAIQPLSLVADVLHSWPEYYDSDKGVWIPIDPTWGSTTGGEDYFNKLDLRHFAFVIHGVDSVKPYPPGSYKLGSNPQKDVYVSFGKLPEGRISQPSITLINKKSIPFFDTIFSLRISNPGPTALYSLTPLVYFDDKLESKGLIDVLLPYSNYDFQAKVPFSILGKNTPDTVSIRVSGSSLEIPTNKNQVVVSSLLILFAGFFVVLIGTFIWIRRITFKGISAKIASAYARFTRKTSQNKNSPRN